jgi:SAM-dependent methyltransferase
METNPMTTQSEGMWMRLFCLALGVLLCTAPACSSGSEKSGTERQEKSEAAQEAAQEAAGDHFYRLEEEEVTVRDFAAKGYILDIGGGGEGIIGRLKGEQTIAIDISKAELEASPPGPLKIIMDARDLQFLDATFHTTTSFFTFMYIDGNDHERVFREISRVLAPGGSFLIWDVLYPVRHDPTKDIALVPLTVKLPDREIRTVYGGAWPDEGRELSHYVGLAEKTGFEIVTKELNGRVFFLELRKPAPGP